MFYVVLLVLGACSWDVGLKGDDEGLGDPMVISFNVGFLNNFCHQELVPWA